MNDFEAKLKKLIPGRPSPDLKRRVFRALNDQQGWRGLLHRHVPLGWAAVLAFFVGFAGYMAAWLHTSSRMSYVDSPAALVHEVTIEKTADASLFDYSDSSTEFFLDSDNLAAWVQVSEGEEQ